MPRAQPTAGSVERQREAVACADGDAGQSRDVLIRRLELDLDRPARRVAEPVSRPGPSVPSAHGPHRSRDDSHPASSSALAAELGRWRTASPVSEPSSGARSSGSKLAASRSRHGVVRSHARSTTYADSNASAARSSAADGSNMSSESSNITSIMRESVATASSWPWGAHRTVGNSETRTGSMIVSSRDRCSGPMSISTCSQIDAGPVLTVPRRT